jgi:hypothetical protein
LNGSAAELGALRVYPTADGSFSLHSDHFGEAFHNSAGALNEARAKFVQPAELQRFSSRSELRILDVCLGLGYNTAAVLEALPTAGPKLQWWGLELDRRPLEQALEQASFQSSGQPLCWRSLKPSATTAAGRSQQLARAQQPRDPALGRRPIDAPADS